MSAQLLRNRLAWWQDSHVTNVGVLIKCLCGWLGADTVEDSARVSPTWRPTPAEKLKTCHAIAFCRPQCLLCEECKMFSGLCSCSKKSHRLNLNISISRKTDNKKFWVNTPPVTMQMVKLSHIVLIKLNKHCPHKSKIITTTSASTLSSFKKKRERDIKCCTTELPVSPSQEAQDEMRKWNIGFQQELSPELTTWHRRTEELHSQHWIPTTKLYKNLIRRFYIDIYLRIFQNTFYGEQPVTCVCFQNLHNKQSTTWSLSFLFKKKI